MTFSPGSSLYGEATWSWLPPARLVVVAMAFGGLPLLRYLGQLLKRPVLVDA